MAGLLITGSVTLIYLTSHKKFMDDALIEKFESKGIEKFIAYEVPLEEAKKRYGRHFDVVRTDLKETDDLRILDYEGCRAFRIFSFKELGEPMMYEKENVEALSSS
jgi:hypothetical protein